MKLISTRFLLLPTIFSVISKGLMSTPSPIEATPHSSVDQNSWTYKSNSKSAVLPCSPTNKCGPDRWFEIFAAIPTVNMCGVTSSTSSKQSPINIVSAAVDETLTFPEDISINGGCRSWTQFAESHAFEVNFADAGCSNLRISYDGYTYTLQQLHFHSPAEHAIGSGKADGELHLVHRSTLGNVLVIAVLLEQSATNIRGSNNLFLDTFWNAAIAQGGGAASSNMSTLANIIHYQWSITSSDVAVNPYKSILPATRDYYTYDGSLTTYPCSEGVKWLVMKDSVEISATDLYYLRAALAKYSATVMDENGNNARPVQPLNNRVVLQYSPSVKTRPGGSSSFTDPSSSYFQKTTTSFPVLLAMATLAGIILSIALALLVVYFWRQHFHLGKFSSFHLSNEGIRSFITTKTTAATSSSSRRNSMGDPTSTSTSSELFHGRVSGFKTPHERLMCKIASASAQQATEEGFRLYHPQNSDYACSTSTSALSGDRGIDVGSSKSYGGPGTVSPGHNRYFYPRFMSSTSTWG